MLQLSNGRYVIDIENMTLEEAVEAHRILWRGIANRVETIGYARLLHEYDPYKIKSEVLYALFYDTRYLFNCCFLCHYDKRIRKMDPEENRPSCFFCPLYNFEDPACSGCLNYLYEYFEVTLGSGSYAEAKTIALRIAELPIVNRKGETLM